MTTDGEIPKCVGMILDGNRRWAKEKGLLPLEGHQRGAERLRDATYWIRDRGIRHLVVYVFSTENWIRSEEEISYLMKLFRTTTEKLFVKLTEENIRIRFVGERGRFEARLQSAMTHLEEISAENSALTLWICLSYGGRTEIVAAAKAAAAKGEVTEKTLAAELWTSDMPDPDIIIRTGGEKRLSGFLAWQSVYSELFFIDEYWPDFSEALLDSVLDEYASRERRMGK